MSQQQTSQSSGRGLLERVFKLREHGTTVRTEAIAGFTTFLTMVYIVFVNPQILGVAGMDTSAVFVTTCLIAAFGSILMGLFANLPVAPGAGDGPERLFSPLWWCRRWGCRGRWAWAPSSGAPWACCC